MLIDVLGQGLSGQGRAEATPNYVILDIPSLPEAVGDKHSVFMPLTRLDVPGIAPKSDGVCSLHALAGAHEPCFRQLVTCLLIVDPFAPVLIDKVPGYEKQSTERAETDHRLP